MWQAGWHFTQWQHIARLILALSLLVSCLCSRFPSHSSAVFLFHVIFLLNFLFFPTSSIFFSFLLYPFMSLLCNLRGVFSSLSLSLSLIWLFSSTLPCLQHLCWKVCATSTAWEDLLNELFWVCMSAFIFSFHTVVLELCLFCTTLLSGLSKYLI